MPVSVSDDESGLTQIKQAVRLRAPSSARFSHRSVSFVAAESEGETAGKESGTLQNIVDNARADRSK